jgi:hypothetical protein
MQITQEVAAKVLSIVDAGLVKGVGLPEPGKMCVEAAVCYALGLPHGDDPACVSRALRQLKIRLNDSRWSSNAARAKGLRRLAVAQLGSRDVLDDKEFARRVVDVVIRIYVPRALRRAVEVVTNPAHKQAMEDAAVRCETEGTRDAALAGKKAAAAPAPDADAAAADADADADAADAAADAADAAYAAYAAADAYAAAAAASAAADAAAAAAAASAADKQLSDFAESVVQILIDMKAPGCQWLALTEVQS